LEVLTLFGESEWRMVLGANIESCFIAEALSPLQLLYSLILF